MSNEEKLPPTLWELVEQSYKDYFPGLVIQGFMVLDIAMADGEGRALRFISSPDSTSWGIKGMLHEVNSQLDADNVAEVLMGDFEAAEVEEDEGEDDE